MEEELVEVMLPLDSHESHATSGARGPQVDWGAPCLYAWPAVSRPSTGVQMELRELEQLYGASLWINTSTSKRHDAMPLFDDSGSWHLW